MYNVMYIVYLLVGLFKEKLNLYHKIISHCTVPPLNRALSNKDFSNRNLLYLELRGSNAHKIESTVRGAEGKSHSKCTSIANVGEGTEHSVNNSAR